MTSSIIIGAFTKVFHATNTFHIPHYLIEDFSKYYLLQWRGDYLQERLKESCYIQHQGFKYSPAFHESMPKGDIDPLAQYQVSFRMLKNHTEGTALIRKKKGF